MALSCLGCGSSVLVVIGALALLVIPPRIFKPDAFIETVEELQHIEIASPKNTFAEYLDHQSVDLFPSIIMLAIGLTVYIYEWIQRKLMERRILKLRAFLGASLERLGETDARRQQLDGTLKLARGAAAEYNLLLFLLLRKRKEEPDCIHPNYV